MLLALVAAVVWFVCLQFRGDLTPKTELTLLSSRAGLVVDPGSKVTFNGVEIGRVAAVSHEDVDGTSKARLTVDVEPRYVKLIPANVIADIRASTVFGNKYVSFRSPEHPISQRVSSGDVITVSSVTTEFNTVFETVTSIAERVDPVKLNATLTATADALTGLGERFGASLTDGNAILGQVNPRMPRIRAEISRLADLADTYADASPDLWDGLRDAVTTAGTINDEQRNIDSALISAIGFSDTASDSFERAAPYFVRSAADLVPVTRLLDDYHGMMFCTIRNFHDIEPRVHKAFGGNGYSLSTFSGTFAGATNPYVYPDNLPRVNAHGGPEGRPGCWQEITKDLWPAPYLVMDAGASIAPYNHIEIGQPMLVDYVWGRQIGEYTINP